MSLERTSGTTARRIRGSSRGCGISSPSLDDPDTVYAGVEDAALFRSTDGGQSWNELPGLREHGTGPAWQPGAGGLCLHTIILDPENRNRIFIAISSAGAFRSDDGGKSWKPINKGLRSEQIPDPVAEVGHCVHHVAQHRSRPDVLYMQKHWDVMRSDDAGDSWREVSDNLPSDFGFVIDVHAHEPDTIYVVPIKSDSEHYPPDGKLRVYRSRSGGDEWEALTKGLPQSDCYVNVLRDAMSVDTLDPCGVYFGTTGGQVYASADAGDSWAPIVRDLPAVLSVEAQDAAMIRVVLPEHLRTLARVDGEVTLEVAAPVTQRSVLDALEARYPMLSGTIRDHRTLPPAAVPAVLRLRAGPVARVAGRAASGRGRDRSRALPGARRDGRRLRGGAPAPPAPSSAPNSLRGEW